MISAQGRIHHIFLFSDFTLKRGQRTFVTGQSWLLVVMAHIILLKVQNCVKVNESFAVGFFSHFHLILVLRHPGVCPSRTSIASFSRTFCFFFSFHLVCPQTVPSTNSTLISASRDGSAVLQKDWLLFNTQLIRTLSLIINKVSLWPADYDYLNSTWLLGRNCVPGARGIPGLPYLFNVWPVWKKRKSFEQHLSSQNVGVVLQFTGRTFKNLGKALQFLENFIIMRWVYESQSPYNGFCVGCADHKGWTAIFAWQRTPVLQGWMPTHPSGQSREPKMQFIYSCSVWPCCHRQPSGVQSTRKYSKRIFPQVAMPGTQICLRLCFRFCNLDGQKCAVLRESPWWFPQTWSTEAESGAEGRRYILQ